MGHHAKKCNLEATPLGGAAAQRPDEHLTRLLLRYFPMTAPTRPCCDDQAARLRPDLPIQIAEAGRSAAMPQIVPLDASQAFIRSAVEQVVAELAGAFDERDAALWLTRPNSWLNQVAPAELIAHDLPAVLQAARADRFVVLG